MKFIILSDAFEKMEQTTKRTELTDILVKLFEITSQEIIENVVYMLQGILRPGFEGVELGIAEKTAMKSIAKSSGAALFEVEKEYKQSGDLGIAASKILKVKTQSTFASTDITVERVYETLLKIANLGGSKTMDLKIRHISSMLSDASPTESKFILKLLLGTLRLGIAENTVMDGLAIAYTGSKDNRSTLEGAYNVSSDLGKVAKTVAMFGIEGILAFSIEVYNPVRPMLANRVKSETEAVKKMGKEFSAEYKLDGERVQIHIGDGRTRIYSRSNEEITSYYPDIVENIGSLLDVSDAILEAEAVAMNQDRTEFLPFQELMHRRRKYGIEQAVIKYPISINFFDLLYVDSQSFLNESYSIRRARLEKIVKKDSSGFSKCIRRIIVKDANAISEFMEESIAAGCEGLMLKSHDSPYKAGSRGNYWLKLKREYRNELGDSLDLVVIGGYFGMGKRTGVYGALLLATYDPDNDIFSSICKVGTGFTDENLDRLYQVLLPKVTLKRDSRIHSGLEPDVWFCPDLVIEVVASEITLSPTHLAALNSLRKDYGMALRFPKFTGKIREEKAAEDASTDEEIISLYRDQTKSAVQDNG